MYLNASLLLIYEIIVVAPQLVGGRDAAEEPGECIWFVSGSRSCLAYLNDALARPHLESNVHADTSQGAVDTKVPLVRSRRQRFKSKNGRKPTLTAGIIDRALNVVSPLAEGSRQVGTLARLEKFDGAQ